MKKLVFIFCLSLTLGSVRAQTAAWDSTFRPANYKVRVDQFKSYPVSKKDIVFLGNSITDYTDWNELLGMSNVRNRGISGDITFGVLDRLDDVLAGKPAKLFILIGINDIARNVPDAVILQNYNRMISRTRALSPKTRIYFHTLLPVNAAAGAPRNHFDKDERILYINEQIKKLADNKSLFVIDLYPHFLDQDKHLKAEYTYDGLHLTAKAYLVWADILKKGGYLK